MRIKYKVLKLVALVLCCQYIIGIPQSFAQQRAEYTGIVYSSGTNTPLEGVSVVVAQTGKATSTDKEGKFTISLTSSESSLRFSFVGYQSKEVVRGQESNFTVYLDPAEGSIDAVVVTALGIKREERSLGYSVGKIGGESLTKVTQENVFGGMTGKIAGVTLNQTGGVGSSVSMVIRGATSLSSDNQPLFVVDGVPISSSVNNVRGMGDRNEVDYGNGVADINPDDIESMTILKGPSAAALYGSRAGNGVVMITTKSGRKGEKTKVNFTTSNVFEKPYRYLDLHYKFGPGDRVGLFDESSGYWSGPELDKGIKEVQWNSPTDANGQKIPTELRSYRDNMKNFVNTSFSSTNNLSLMGSGNKFVYRFSLNHLNHKGLIPNSDLYRNGLNSSISYDFRDNLKLSTNINVVRSNSNQMPSTGNRGGSPLQAVYSYPHVDIRDLKNYWEDGQEHIKQRQVAPEMDNPYFLAYALTNGFVRDRVYGNIKLDWTINPNVSAFFRAAESRSNEQRETKIPWSYSRDMKGGYHLQDLTDKENNFDFLFTYKGTDNGSDFKYSASGGGNYMYRYWSDFYSGSDRNAGLTIPGLYRLDNIPRSGLNTYNRNYKKMVLSMYAMANLSYKDQLYLDITARNDWSSTLGENKRSYFYPSASLSWVANETLALPDQISMLKFRTGWAQVGNDTGPYQLDPALGLGKWGDIIYSDVPGTLYNRDLKPEIATSSEFGLDLNMFSNRLRFEGTYYQAQNKNQILSVEMPGSAGYSRKNINAGKLESRGWEFTLGGTPIKQENGLTWDVNVSFTRTRTKILELTPGIDYINFWDENGAGAYTWVGQEVGNIYSRGYAYVTDPTSEYYRWPLLSKNGEWQRVDTKEAMIKVGNFNPNFLAGMQSTFNYKRFSLSFSLDWRNGGQFQSFTYRYAGSDWKSQIQLDNMIPGGLYSPEELANLLRSDPEKYIIPRNGNYPRVGGLTKETGGFYYDSGSFASYDGSFTPGVIGVYDNDGKLVGYKENLGEDGTVVFESSDQYPWNYNQDITFDADYLKLRELSIGYDVPKVKGISNLRVSVFTRNIMLWNKAKIGVDPERAFKASSNGNFQQGIEMNNVTPWTIPFGVKLDLTF